MNIALSAVEYQVALRRVNVSLPLSLIEELLDLLSQLKDSGKVRQTVDGQSSVLDFIENVVGKKTGREVWKRLQDKHSHKVTFCDLIKFPRKDGKISAYQTPVATNLGMLVIAYLLPGELGDRLRLASAELVIEALDAYKNNLNTLFEKEEASTAVLAERIAELEQQLQTAVYPHTWDELHKVSGIVDKYQVRDAIKNFFEEGKDYLIDGKEWRLSPSCFYILTVSFRSAKGTDISKLPQCIVLETKRYFQYLDDWRRAKNKRTSHRYTDGQLEIQYTY